uniref:Uncharacterized protein n=1 Tax=Oryza sativa subsp. japonica TaxID=39947 RepID=Q6EQX5_ORYSJ|nr:hypothetical protein [Oryza sativa Japonica Group]
MPRWIWRLEGHHRHRYCLPSPPPRRIVSLYPFLVITPFYDVALIPFLASTIRSPSSGPTAGFNSHWDGDGGKRQGGSRQEARDG